MMRIIGLLAVILGAPTIVIAALPLVTQVEDGGEHAYVQGPGGAACVSLTARPVGRLVVGFPAGNSGVGLWLSKPVAPGAWKLGGPLELVPADATGRHGVRGSVTTTEKALAFRAPLGGSLRFLREYDRQPDMVPEGALSGLPARIAAATPEALARALKAGFDAAALGRWTAPGREQTARTFKLWWSGLSGRGGNAILLSVEEGGRIERTDDGRVTLYPGPAGRFGFRAECGHAPLTPWDEDAIFEKDALARCQKLEDADPVRGKRLREGLGRLRFLVYREKLLAGSWRYLTYFGRDTLITLRMLMPVFTVPVVEGALDSVLARMSPEGRVAHEEDLGDQAVLDRVNAALDGKPIGPGPVDAPVHDYKMVDSDFLLPIALAEYAGDRRVGPATARAFLGAGGRLARVHINAERVLTQALPFADDQRSDRLVSLEPGSVVGDWRDSEDGLARGRYAYSVNAILVPQALDALETLLAAGVLGAPEEMRGTPTLARVARERTELARMRAAWAKARNHFIVRLNAKEIDFQARRYLGEGPLGEPERAALTAALARPQAPRADEFLAYPHVSQDAKGNVTGVICSDDVMGLFGPPLDAQRVVESVRPLVEPFPRGLFTDAGLLVASPALSGNAELWGRFARKHYHGTVVWAWPMAMAEMGINRQLAAIGHGPVREELERARDRFRAARRAIEARGLGELWSFHAKDGAIEPYPFGADAGDTTESNALQLWSAAWLALALTDAP